MHASKIYYRVDLFYFITPDLTPEEKQSRLLLGKRKLKFLIKEEDAASGNQTEDFSTFQMT